MGHPSRHRNEMSALQHSNIYSDREAAIWLKFIVPLMLFVDGIGIFGKYVLTWRIVFIFPSVFAALFLSSLAVVQLRDGTLRYKRFFKWTVINRGEVVGSGVTLLGAIGYVRHHVSPWGKLFFVLDRNLSPNPFRVREYALLRCLGGDTNMQNRPGAGLTN